MSTAAHRSSIRWAVFGLIASIVLIAIKLAGYFITHSTAVLADALESCVHIITSSVALYAVWLSAQPGDDNHPYGHGKVEYLSAGLEGILVLGTGAAIAVLAVWRLFRPIELPDLHIGAGVELLAAVVAFVVGTALARAGRRNSSPTLEADGVHIRSDAYTSFAAFIGVGLAVLTGAQWLDAAIALVVGVALTYTGGRVAREALGGIMDEANPELLERIAAVFRKVRAPGWIAPHAVKVHRLGQSIHIDMHVVFPFYWSLEKAHDATHVLIDALREEFGERTEPMIHAEACVPSNCALCDLTDCDARQTPFQGLPDWTPERIGRRQRPSVPVSAPDAEE